MHQNDRLISVKQVSDILGIGVSTVWLWENIKPPFHNPSSYPRAVHAGRLLKSTHSPKA